MLLFFFRRRFPVAVLLLLQLGAFGFLLFSGSLLSGILGTLLRLLSILVALAVIARPDSSGYKLLWLFLLLLLPLFGGAFIFCCACRARRRDWTPMIGAWNGVIRI